MGYKSMSQMFVDSHLAKDVCESGSNTNDNSSELDAPPILFFEIARMNGFEKTWFSLRSRRGIRIIHPGCGIVDMLTPSSFGDSRYFQLLKILKFYLII